MIARDSDASKKFYRTVIILFDYNVGTSVRSTPKQIRM